MLRAISVLLALALPASVFAQDIEERTAPFKQSGTLDDRLSPDEADAGTFAAVPPQDVTAELLETARVIDATGNRIGPIVGLVYDTGGRIDGLVVDVGGVVGIGQKPVRVDLAAVDVGVSEEYDSVRVILPYSESELSEMDPFPVE